MTATAELLAKLDDTIQGIKEHLATMDRSSLDVIASQLRPKSPAGSAEMMLVILIYREIEIRNTAN